MTFQHQVKRTRILGCAALFSATVAVGLTRGGDAPALSPALMELDERAGKITDVTASFEERKFTMLLKKPMVSTGRVSIKGSRTRWDTLKPYKTVTLLDKHELRIYYPRRSTLEVYELDDRLRWLAASPLPKLSVLQEYFTITEIPTSQLPKGYNAKKQAAIRMVPKDGMLADYLVHVDVVIARASAVVQRAEMLDVDGDRTVLLFSKIRVNTGMGDEGVAFVPPSGTEIVRPLGEKDEASASPGAKP